MADVNQPLLQVPPSLLGSDDVRRYLEQVNFTIFQLWKRTGGGNDDIADGAECCEENRALIDINIGNISDNSVAIGINATNIALNAADIDALELVVGDLQQTFSWKTIPIGEEITIGVNQQMIVADGINVEGSLVIDGELSLI